MNKNPTEKFIRTAFILNFSEDLEIEDEESSDRNCVAASLMVAARQGSSTVQFPRIPFSFLCLPAIQGYIDGHMIAPGSMSHVAISRGTLSSSRLSTLLEKSQTKKNQALIYQGQGKIIITATGDTTKMLIIG